MPFVAEFSDITSNSAYFYAEFTGGDSSYGRYRSVKLVIDNFDTFIFDSNNEGGSDSYFDYVVNGLDSNTTYTWKATLGYYETATSGTPTWLSLSDSGSFTTKNQSSVIPWSWDISNGDATDIQTQNAYLILNGDKSVNNFSHKVWNDFVDKVMEIRTHIGDGTWDTVNGDYLSYNDCKVYAGDTLSADIYNSVKYQIGSVVPTDILDVSSGDKLTGYHVIHIIDVLNEIIESL